MHSIKKIVISNLNKVKKKIRFQKQHNVLLIKNVKSFVPLI